MKTFSIIRYHQEGGQRVRRSWLTLEEAQEWCNDPESSSQTAKSESAQAYTRYHGDWFDGYIEEEGA